MRKVPARPGDQFDSPGWVLASALGTPLTVVSTMTPRSRPVNVRMAAKTRDIFDARSGTPLYSEEALLHEAVRVRGARFALQRESIVLDLL
jgi:hypothetical protein